MKSRLEDPAAYEPWEAHIRTNVEWDEKNSVFRAQTIGLENEVWATGPTTGAALTAVVSKLEQEQGYAGARIHLHVRPR